MMKQIEYCLILGATKGLGKEIARECWTRKWPTVEVGRSIKDGTEGNRVYLQADLSEDKSAEELLKKLSPYEGKINRFFWVAGRMLKGSLSDQSSEEVQETVDVNIRNPITIAHWVWRQMQSTNMPKTYTVISSTSGVKARSDEAIYSATKFFQVGFTRSLMLENKNPNITISLFRPGGMQTELWSKFPQADYSTFLDPKKVAARIVSLIEKRQESFEEEIPRGSL